MGDVQYEAARLVDVLHSGGLWACGCAAQWGWFLGHNGAGSWGTMGLVLGAQWGWFLGHNGAGSWGTMGLVLGA
jgi:hypothetical protein